jgi:peptidoglycan/xylan/chitin deacetylase (PgdA/CDA1 family)
MTNAIFKTTKHTILFAILFVMSMTGIQSNAQTAGVNLVQNPSLETASGTTATGWSKVKWGTNAATFTIANEGQDGSKSVKAQVTSYTSGDVRWAYQDVAVSPSKEYTTSLWYKTDANAILLVATTLQNNTKIYTYLGTLANSTTTWKQSSVKFTTNAQAKSVNVYAAINKVGFIQTDNYSLTSAVVTPPPTTNGFTRPIVSFDFDDGWKNAYNDGFPVVEQFGFKATSGIITDTIDNVQGYGDEYMTSSQIIDLKNRGHRIAAHSRTHRDLPTLSQTEITSEVKDSQTKLRQLTGQSINYFITPFCDYNTAVTNTVKQYYSAGMRNCDDIINFKTSYNKYNIKSFIVTRNTTLTEIQNAIDSVKGENAWIVFMYHEVRSLQGTDDLWVTKDQLTQQMQLIKNSGITVLPSEDALAEINAQV